MWAIFPRSILIPHERAVLQWHYTETCARFGKTRAKLTDQLAHQTVKWASQTPETEVRSQEWENKKSNFSCIGKDNEHNIILLPLCFLLSDLCQYQLSISIWSPSRPRERMVFLLTLPPSSEWIERRFCCKPGEKKEEIFSPPSLISPMTLPFIFLSAFAGLCPGLCPSFFLKADRLPRSGVKDQGRRSEAFSDKPSLIQLIKLSSIDRHFRILESLLCDGARYIRSRSKTFKKTTTGTG